MGAVAVQGLHRIEVAGNDGKVSQASVELRYRRIHVRPPIGKQKRYPALDLTVIHAQERCKPEGRAAIDWKLITDLPVRSPKEAIEKLGWYARRWQIELFHKILKSGCRAEETRLRTAERLGPAPWEWRDGIRTSCGFEHGDPFHAGPRLERGAIAQGRVQALPIVEDFDVVEHGCPGFLTRAEAGVVDVLLLE